MFRDVESHFLDWLKAEFPSLADTGIDDPDTHVGRATPDDLQDRFPFVRVARGGGGGTRREDFPVLDVDVFDSTRQSAYDLSEAIRERLLGVPLILAGLRIDSVETEVAPRRLPWDADGTHRRSATYNLGYRR